MDLDDGEVIEIEGEIDRSPGGGGTVLDTEAGRRAPGSLGDALVAAQSLPGVARQRAGSGDLIVWGAAPGETRILIDDVPVPALYHLGGFRSIFPDALVRDLELDPAAFGPAHGGALGGLVRVSTRGLAEDGAHGELSADVLDAAAAASVAETARGGEGDREGLSATVAGRFGYAAETLAAADEDVEDLVPLSAYRSYAAKATRRRGGGRTELLLFGASDAVRRRLPTTDPTSELGERERRWFHRASARHRRRRGGVVSEVQLWGGIDRRDLRARFGELSTRLASTTHRLGARASRRQPVGELSLLEIGVDLEGARADLERAGTAALPAREGDVTVFGQAPSDRVGEDRWTVDQASLAVYGEMEIPLADYRLLLRPGLRLEPIVIGGDRLLPPAGGGVEVGYSRFHVAVSPRLAARYQVSGSLRLDAAAGVHHQAPAPADLSSVFGATDLRPARAAHGLLGAVFGPGGSAELEVAAFARASDRRAVRSPEPSPPVAEALVDEGRGRAYGLQVVFRHRGWRGLYGWVSYALTRSEREDAGGAGWRPSDFDQTHALVALAGYRRGRWELGARGRVTSGFPRTPVTGAYYDAAGDRFHPIFGEHNGARLPAFAQLDLRAARRFRLAGGAELTAYLEVLNATARENPEEVVYSYDFSERAYLTGLPPTAVAGARLRY